MSPTTEPASRERGTLRFARQVVRWRHIAVGLAAVAPVEGAGHAHQLGKGLGREDGFLLHHDRDRHQRSVAGALGEAVLHVDEGRFIRHTGLFNMSGCAAITLPLAWTDSGLPLGMMFGARFGDEASLFRIAGQLERARPWADRVPPVVERRRGVLEREMPS